jgi:5-formyltetrahydrofolate cyclo-ligase
VRAVLDAIQTRKRELRRAALAQSVCAGIDRIAAVERRIRLLLARSLPTPERALVALYVPLRGEVGTEEIFDALWSSGALTALPRIEGSELQLRMVTRGAELVPGALGVREPRAEDPPVAAHEVDAFLVPGLLFDRSGARLGRGRGYYDRLLGLARREALRVGLCFSEHLIAELPVAPWDERMDYVITDRETLASARSGRDSA